MRITPDTAILVRANLKASGPAKELLHLVQQSGARLVLSPFLLTEVARALRYPRLQAIYNLSDQGVAEHVQYLESISEIVAPAEGPPIVFERP